MSTAARLKFKSKDVDHNSFSKYLDRKFSEFNGRKQKKRQKAKVANEKRRSVSTVILFNNCFVSWGN